MNPTAFERLRESGIPIDWPTAFLGWHGIGSRGRWIGSGEVRDYAFERLASGPSPSDNENALIDLAFVEEGDHWTIQRCLEQLASVSPQNPERSRSIWRWFFLDEVVTELEQRSANRPAEDSPDYLYWQEEFFSGLYCDLRDFWEDFPFPTGEFSVSDDDWRELWKNTHGETGAELLDECRNWLGRERDRLIASGYPDQEKEL